MISDGKAAEASVLEYFCSLTYNGACGLENIMSIKQIIIWLFVKKIELTENGDTIETLSCREIDLVKTDIKKFLSEFNGSSQDIIEVWVSITGENNQTRSFVDGVKHEFKTSENQLNSLNFDPDKVDDRRKNATIWAERRLDRAEENN